MKYGNAIIPVFVFCFVTLTSWAFERELGYIETPIPSYFYPDTNFTVMSHAFPTSPRDQVLVNGHLYVAMGAYIVIYELLPDGQLQETCSKMTDHVITSIAHDGSYLYLSGDNGIQIYDGTDYVDPQLVGSNPLRYLEWATKISVWGDSLYYWWDDPAPGEFYLGIMDVHDRSNPQVAGEFVEILFSASLLRPLKYDRYLILPRRTSPYDGDFGIYYLDHPSGVPALVDSFDTYGHRNIELFDDRIYVCTYDLYIFQFTNVPHVELRSQLTMPDIITDIAEVEIGGNRYGYVCSRDGFIYEINLNDLTNPVIVDSLVMPHDQYDFHDIEQYNEYSYAMTSQLYGSVYHPGVHVIDWTSPGGPELVQMAKKHSYCNTVKVIGDVAYAETDNDGILVVDLTDKNNPRVVDLGYTISGGYVKGDSNTLYTQYGNSVMFYDISDPLAPTLEWVCPIPLDPGRYLFDYEIYDTLLIAYYYIGSLGGPGAAKILDISDRNNVRVLSTIPVEDHIRPMCLDYPRLYLPTNEHWYTEVYDISDPANPDHIATLHNSTGGISGVYTYENYVYVTGGANRVYHWNQWNQIIFDMLLDFRPEFMVTEEGRIFYWGAREWAGPTGIQVWDAWQDPVNPIFSGYHYDETLSLWRKIDVEWPYVYIPGGDKGLVVLRYDPTTGIAEEEVKVSKNHEISLIAYPNPFNSSVTISILSKGTLSGDLRIYDIQGRLVNEFVIDRNNISDNSIVWTGDDSRGINVSSGIYFARFSSGGLGGIVKLLLLK